MSLNSKMGDAHEQFLADLFGGRRSRGSGNQWRDPMDGRSGRRHEQSDFAFAWDGKSTLAKSVGVSLAMWDKAVDQADGERPMLGLRYYANERLDVVRDLVVVSAYDLSEMLTSLREGGLR